MKPDFTQKLLEWNASHNLRQMPWKGEPDPYRIWLSEIILQQTRVDQGWMYYENFVKAFPDVHSLANAPESVVYKMWEGLGYYSRCNNLINTARVISREYQGKFPTKYTDIIQLKGIGPYTAAAIASFAFNECRAVTDGNVIRVLARYFGISTPADSSKGRLLFNELAGSLIDTDAPGMYNQAIMDFGATVCKPRNPLCESCIQSSECEAFNHGFIDMVPAKEKKLKRRARCFYYFIIEVDEFVYIRKREQKDIWQNLHEFVLYEADNEYPLQHTEFLAKLLQGRSYQMLYESEMQTQQLTHQQIRGKFFVVKLHSECTIAGNYILVKKCNLNEYAFPKFINKFLENLPD